MIQLPLRIFTKSEDFPFCIQYGYHDTECYMHGHEDFSELVIVLEGSAEHRVGSEHYPISQGDVFVINQDTEHGFTGVSGFRICNIMFRPEVLFDQIYNIRQSAGFQALFVIAPHYLQNCRFSSRLHLQSQEFAAVKGMIRDMIAEYNRRQEGWQTYCFACFLQLCVRLSRLYQLCDTEQHRCVMQLAAATAYMERHFCSSINIADLSEMSVTPSGNSAVSSKELMVFLPTHILPGCGFRRHSSCCRVPICPSGKSPGAAALRIRTISAAYLGR